MPKEYELSLPCDQWRGPFQCTRFLEHDGKCEFADQEDYDKWDAAQAEERFKKMFVDHPQENLIQIEAPWAFEAATKIEDAARASESMRCPAAIVMHRIIVDTFLKHLAGIGEVTER